MLTDHLPVHPLCDLFPLMDGEQYARFVADIKANGLIHPVVVHNGQIVDGRNRMRACYELGLLPVPTVEWLDDGYMSLEQWIWSTNVQRRHLTPEQIAGAMVALHNYGRARGDHGQFVRSPRHHLNPGDGFTPDPHHVTRSLLAKEAGVSQFQIERARTIHLADPDLLRDVVRGTISAAEALAKVRSGSVPAPPPPRPPSGTATERETRDRMIRVLSNINGLCRGFDTLDTHALRNACDAKEIKVWASVARTAARVLRGFAADLLQEQEQREAHN